MGPAKVKTRYGLVVLTVLLSASCVMGQTGSILAEPFVSSDQEKAVFEFMNRPCKFQWDGASTIEEMRGDLAKHVPVVIDSAGLAEVGIKTNACFGSKGSGQLGLLARTTVTDADDSKPKWWRQGGGVTGDLHVTNGARILFLLNQMDLTMNFQNGQLAITTPENAEQSLLTGVYDVSRLAVQTKDAAAEGFFAESMSLMDVLKSTVEPDTWEELGGPSTMVRIESLGRIRLVVSAPLLVHWRLRALLQTLEG